MSNFEHGEAEVELTAYFSETIYETKFFEVSLIPHILRDKLREHDYLQFLLLFYL